MAGDIDKTYGDQAASTAYDFNMSWGSYTQDKNTRAMATDFALAEGVRTCNNGGCDDQDTSSSYQDAGGCFWLRSPGVGPGDAAGVIADGHVYAVGLEVGGDDFGVRPALLTNLAPVICLQDAALLPWSFNNAGSWQAISSITNPLELSFSGGNTLTTETGQTAAQAAGTAASHLAAERPATRAATPSAFAPPY